MLSNRPYSLLSALLGCLFCIFTVGIPVVLASCPMMHLTGQTRSCCPEQADRSRPMLTAYKNTSCCTTIVVATRSTQEYVQSESSLAKAAGVQFIAGALVSAALIPDAVSASSGLTLAASPPLHRPLLPIFNASLLI
jgi:hypothetical protein